MPPSRRAPFRALPPMLTSPSAAGIILMGAALLSLAIANSPAAPCHDAMVHRMVGPLSFGHWVNDGLMAIFFLFVGLEIKREVLVGELATWPRRALPGLAALGGMVVPALVYLAFNRGGTAHGWAIPAATDIAFALAVIRLVGDRVPASLRVFLAALAIIDDLGAVIVIALFYTAALSPVDLFGAALALGVLVGFSRFGMRRLSPYLLVGMLLWVFMLRSGIHATIAGVLLAFTIPMGRTEDGPLHRLERALHRPVAFGILPLFGLVNAGVRIVDLPLSSWVSPITLGVGAGLAVGKVAGVYGTTMLAVRLRLADLPGGASSMQMLGTALLCGIGFTMSLFITLLAFPGDPPMQASAKMGVLAGSLLAGTLGYAVLRRASRR